MKKCLVFLFALVFAFYGYSQDGRPAKELLDIALLKAKKENKNVFIIFTATWCSPCKMLKECLVDVYNAAYIDEHYVLLELYNSERGDKKRLENEGAQNILRQYKGDSTAIPYWLIIHPNGKKLHGELGFSNDKESLNNFIKALKATSKLRDGELKMIHERIIQLFKILP